MSQITKESVKAFKQGSNYSKLNTKVMILEDGTRLFILHGNEIARFTPNNELGITNCGWPTLLTKTRLNAIMGYKAITQRKFKWYIDGMLWDGEWIQVHPNGFSFNGKEN